MQRERRRYATEGIGGLATDWSTRLRDLHAFERALDFEYFVLLERGHFNSWQGKGAKGYVVSRLGLLARYPPVCFHSIFSH